MCCTALLTRERFTTLQWDAQWKTSLSNDYEIISNVFRLFLCVRNKSTQNAKRGSRESSTGRPDPRATLKPRPHESYGNLPALTHPAQHSTRSHYRRRPGPTAPRLAASTLHTHVPSGQLPDRHTGPFRGGPTQQRLALGHFAGRPAPPTWPRAHPARAGSFF